MKIRAETMLNLLIVVVLAVDAFVALQIFQQRISTPEPLALPSAVTTTTASPANGENGETDPSNTPGNTTVNAVVAAQADVSSKSAMQSAVLTAELAFVDDGVMPAGAFALEAAVPGVRFADGLNRAAVGVIGIERSDATILFVTAINESDWICASVDGNNQTTGYGRGATRDSVSAMSSCSGGKGTWG